MSNTWNPQIGDTGLTRDGNGYEIVYIAPPHVEGDYPIFAIVDNKIERYTADGHYYFDEDESSELDLNPPTKLVFVNFYPNNAAYYYATEEQARYAANRGRGVNALSVAVRVELPL